MLQVLIYHLGPFYYWYTFFWTGCADNGYSDDNLTDTETEATPTSSPLKQLAGHRLSHSHRIGYSSHDESLELSDVFPSGHLPSLPSPPPRVDLADEESRSSMSAADIGQIRDVLITATEDFDPIGGKALQTTDQDQGKTFLSFKFVCFLGYKSKCCTRAEFVVKFRVSPWRSILFRWASIGRSCC